MFVRTASPSGTPATITILSPDSTNPASSATRSATSNISSVDAGLSARTGITPQLIINERCTFSSNVTAKMSASGRNLEMARAVLPVSVIVTTSLISIECVASLTADAITSVLLLRGNADESKRPYSLSNV